MECGCEPVNCDDSNACTMDYCDPQVAMCKNDYLDCDDDNECTEDSCDPFVGCVNQLKDCDDGDPCTEGDACVDGDCVPGDDICPEPCETGSKIACNGITFGTIAAMPPTMLDSYNCSEYSYPTMEVIYEFTATCNGQATATLNKTWVQWPPDDDEGMLDALVLDTDLGCTGDACIAAGLMEGGLMGYSAKVSFKTEQGHKYDIVVDGREGGTGQYTLSVMCLCSLPGW